MSLRKICDFELAAVPGEDLRPLAYRLARDGEYVLTRSGGEDPYGTPYHVVVRADQVRDMAPELLQLLGATMEELLDLKAKLAVRSERAES